METELSKAEIQKIYEKAKTDWVDGQDVLEELFPELKELTIDEIITKVTFSLGGQIPTIYNCQYCHITKMDDHHLAIDLPNCNKKWTYQSFDTVKKLVEILTSNGYIAYPVHSSWKKFDNTHYLYVYYSKK